jgi:hypothetical protein
MRQTIDTAPRSGEFVIIVDEADGHFEVAQWSKSEEWLREDGSSSKVRPTHWSPIAGTKRQPFNLDANRHLNTPLSVVTPNPTPPKLSNDDLAPRVADAPAIVPAAEVPAATETAQEAPNHRMRWATPMVAAGVGGLLIGLVVQPRFVDRLASYPALQNIYGKYVDLGRAGTANNLGNTSVEAQSYPETKGRLDALTSELAEARRYVDTLNLELREQTAKVQSLEQNIEKERAGTASLSNELATARRELQANLSKQNEEAAEEVQIAHSTTAALQRSFQEEHRRVALLENELAAARRDIEAKAKLAADELAKLTTTSKATISELRQSLQKEQYKGTRLGEALKRNNEARRLDNQNVQTSPSASQQRTAPPPPSPAQNGPEAERLTARAKAFLVQGNIASARGLLERAVEMGNADASFALAETYDPRILSSWRTYGITGDESKARDLYAKAAAGGVQQAKDRIESLRQ